MAEEGKYVFSYDLSVKNILKFLIAVVNYSHVMNKTITLKAKKQKQKQTNKTKQNKTKQNNCYF